MVRNKKALLLLMSARELRQIIKYSISVTGVLAAKKELKRRGLKPTLKSRKK